MKPMELLAVLHTAERLKDTTRHCYTSQGRHESVAEHSWRVTLMAYLMRDEFPELDMGKVMQMCLIHDLGECFRNCKTVCVMENGTSGPVTDMETLVLRPSSEGAARLAGCRNFLPGRRCEDGVRLEGWDILLPAAAEQDAVTVAIPEAAIRLGAGDQRCAVRRVIRDLDSTVVLIGPASGEDAAMLRAVVPDGVAVEEGASLPFTLLAEKCLCY